MNNHEATYRSIKAIIARMNKDNISGNDTAFQDALDALVNHLCSNGTKRIELTGKPIDNEEEDKVKEELAKVGIRDYDACMIWVYGKDWRCKTPKEYESIYKMRFGDIPAGYSRAQVIAQKWKGMKTR